MATFTAKVGIIIKNSKYLLSEPVLFETRVFFF